MTQEVTLVRCPWHDEQTPSCAVHQPSGQVYCFGCGHEATLSEFRSALARKGREWTPPARTPEMTPGDDAL